MNLRKRSAASDKNKVVNECLSKHLKHWPENVRRKRTAHSQLRSNTIPGWCIKKSALGWVELAKPLDDNDRKMLFSLAAMDSDSTSELQAFFKSSGARCKGITEGSCKIKRVRCPSVGTLPNDSVIKVVNPSSVKKYPKQLRIGGVPCLNEDLIKFVNCPEIIRKKRSSSSLGEGSVRPGKRRKGSRRKIRTFSTHSLPEELVEEILSRLPVKTIARFRCVCKSWEHLSYSKRFISLHLNNYRTSQFLVGTCGMLSRCAMYFLPPPPPTGDYCYKGGATQEILKPEFPHLFGGCCNGIVCLYGECAVDDIVLWNPGTNESKRIQGLGEFSYRSKCAVGLGYDPLTDDYKILKMVYGKFDPPVAQLELYSLRKGLWKRVDRHEFMVVPCRGPVGLACSLPFTNNRIVCAVVAPINGASKWEVIKFDMSRETYEVIALPPSLDAELGDPRRDLFQGISQNRYFKLLPFKESIAVGIVQAIGMGSYSEVWELKDFSSCSQRREKSCWSKLLSANMNKGRGDTVPVGCWGSNEIIFQERSSRRVCIHMESDTQHNKSRMMELRGVVPRAWVFTAPYKESLVRITDTHIPRSN